GIQDLLPPPLANALRGSPIPTRESPPRLAAVATHVRKGFRPACLRLPEPVRSNPGGPITSVYHAPGTSGPESGFGSSGRMTRHSETGRIRVLRSPSPLGGSATG